MTHRRLISLVLAGGLWACALPASASQHLMRVVEVFPGTAAAPNAQYIVLQSYDINQQFVAGYTVAIFDANDALVTSFTFAGNVPNAAANSKILIATPEAEALFSVTADMAMTPSLPLAAGAVCFGAAPAYGFDCLTWGNFVDGPGGASGAGTPYRQFTGGLAQGQALVCDPLAHGNTDMNFDDCVDSKADHDCGDAEPLANPVGSTPGFLAANPPCPVCGNDTSELGEECDGTDDGACPGDCQVDCSCFSESPILGKILLVKDAQPGNPTRRKLVLKAKEAASPHPLTGNPITGGATLEISLSGTTPSTQTFTLPAGAAFWSPLGTIGFKYKDTDLVNGPIKLLIVKKTGSGNFILTVLAKGTTGALSLVPPNTGTSAVASLVTGTGGDEFCVSFGGMAGGTADPNDQRTFKVKNPTADIACPPL